MSGFDIARDCSHGMLGRACERCDDAREIAELRARVAELDAERKRLLDSLIVASIELDELRARTEAAEDERDQFAEALQAAVRANKAQPECSATNTPTAPARQYFYKNNACQAADSADSDCICWHDEGTGPRHEESHGVRLRWREAR